MYVHTWNFFILQVSGITLRLDVVKRGSCSSGIEVCCVFSMLVCLYHDIIPTVSLTKPIFVLYKVINPFHFRFAYDTHFYSLSKIESSSAHKICVLIFYVDLMFNL